jgi:hypothetical protein
MEGKAKMSLLEHQASAPDTAKLFAHPDRRRKWASATTCDQVDAAAG